MGLSVPSMTDTSQIPVGNVPVRLSVRKEKTESGETDYPEAELRKAAQLCALQRAGMELEELKKLCDLQRSGCCEAKIRLLRKCRCRLLEEIHQKQQALDRLDYLIYRMKNPKE